MGTNIQEMRQLLETNPERLQMLKDAVKAQHPEIAQVNRRKVSWFFPTVSLFLLSS